MTGTASTGTVNLENRETNTPVIISLDRKGKDHGLLGESYIQGTTMMKGHEHLAGLVRRAIIESLLDLDKTPDGMEEEQPTQMDDLEDLDDEMNLIQYKKDTKIEVLAWREKIKSESCRKKGQKK